MYTAQNGPLVKVFFENDGLKAAQMPNEQFSVVLMPTTESEFYIREFNFAVAFEKDPTTNDNVMVVYQSGQKIRLEKVK